MIVGLGMDVTELDRIAKVYERHGERFLEKILTPAERAAMPAKAVPFLAARFAAKEAGAKALGTGFRGGVWYKEIEVTADALGKPRVLFHGHARERAMSLGVTHTHVSLTHGRDVAAAVVVLEAP
ncbi:holo-[acyl-carrier-protein] synthase [Fundidesulfovibrio terrae]|uniref:holo-[acyl-carrier-protein] synthase n=1 Tax=Fundidesulfovibrio terrae TaxID=2922866 RepID=UPI001FAE979A|nr:holo-[acyl-carrier-protein] synthase [Fundidesulfovibrio terrae]